jgi:hypothetical protein
MKKLFYLSTLLLFSCSTNSSAQESLIIEYLETSPKGVRTDLKMNVLKLELSNVTAADSLAFLEAQFQNRIKEEKKSIRSFKLNIQEALKENKSLDPSNIDNLAKISANKSIMSLYEKGIEKARLALEKIQSQKVLAIEKYNSKDEDELLVKKAITKFSYLNPKMNTRQERTETFVLSKDGSEVLGILYKDKLRRKR